MTRFLKNYYDTEGPFGLPMKDKQAKALEARLKELPKDEEAYSFRRLSLGAGLSELQPGERADVSWITEESPDRLGDIVLAAGMDDSHFQQNPIVTLNHCYHQPPVGRSLWRRKVKEGTRRGVKAKTHYPPRPASWPQEEWLPDYAYELVKADLLRGKSIGFFPLKVRTPTADEIGDNPALAKVRYIIEEWLLAEYACCFLPMQPNAVVEQVSKSVPRHVARILGLECGPLAPRAEVDSRSESTTLAFTTLEEIAKSVRRHLRSAAFERTLENNLRLSLQTLRGQV